MRNLSSLFGGKREELVLLFILEIKKLSLQDAIRVPFIKYFLNQFAKIAKKRNKNSQVKEYGSLNPF